MKCRQCTSLLKFLVFSNGVAAVDLKNVDKSQIAGGPIGRTISNTPSSIPDRLRHVPYKYKSQRRVPLKEMYSGSSHEKALDAQIQAYKPKALKNILGFGGYAGRWMNYSQFKTMLDDITKPRDLRDEFLKLEKSRDIKLSFKEGTKWLIKIDVHE